jgi:hypothetical protein
MKCQLATYKKVQHQDERGESWTAAARRGFSPSRLQALSAVIPSRRHKKRGRLMAAS